MYTVKRAARTKGIPMHDTPDQVHWHEPKAGENAGFGKFLRKPMPYDTFMESEGVPIYRGIGVRRVQDLPLAPWQRLGGRFTARLVGPKRLKGKVKEVVIHSVLSESSNNSPI